jgi:amidase
MSELHYQSLSDTCRQLKSGALSSAELTEYMVSRIVDHDEQLKSYALLMIESAAQQAAQLDADRQAGKPLGPLHGVPIAIKDLLFTKGVPTASGTLVMRDFKPDFDATVVTRLREAGAVIIGKTQLTEGAFGAHHPEIDPPKNPYNPNHWPGVSSSGSGVAVAAGLAFGALGTDTGGSIRFPSAACGLVGIKPTYGRVSRHGAFALADSLDHIGPMCRSVEDAARMLEVIAGQDPNDATSLKAAVPNYVAAAAEPLGKLVIGVDWTYASSGVDDEVVGALHAACKRFTDAGAEIVEVQMPPEYRQLVDEWGITCGVECARAHAQYFPARRDEYGPVLSSLIDLGLSVPQEKYDELEVVRASFRQKLDLVLAEVDVLLAPCMTSVAPTVEEMDRSVSSEDGRAAFITFTAPFDYSGHPTITLPAGLNQAGLPLSFQLIGAHLSEPLLVRAGSAHEQALGPMPHPPV